MGTLNNNNLQKIQSMNRKPSQLSKTDTFMTLSLPDQYKVSAETTAVAIVTRLTKTTTNFPSPPKLRSPFCKRCHSMLPITRCT